ncbi:hypothetical protein TARUN_1393 [Trichoderma arundinaceum]|uniref:Uncharacterized protein n=1 Tax=Trichoderma arundinaceum TaxID=490622 RepID=A0A395NXM5_TRIAR|nr:hypothetical protein TARUN_1393 [Trichoderma arundinaceum]
MYTNTPIIESHAKVLPGSHGNSPSGVQMIGAGAPDPVSRRRLAKSRWNSGGGCSSADDGSPANNYNVALGTRYPWQPSSEQIVATMTELIYHNGHYHQVSNRDRRRQKRDDDWSVMKFWDEVLYSIGDLYYKVRRR